MSTVIPPIVDEIEYPTSDGKPMAETDIHRDLMVDLIETLRSYYAHRPDVYVSGNLMVYYEPGNPRKFLSPDCFVIFGVPNTKRMLYKSWEEGNHFPSVVIEITSKITRKKDQGKKLETYRDVWKVDEYFLFDPRAEYLAPRLQGYRRVGELYERMVPLVEDVLLSTVLGLRLEGAGTELLLVEAATNRLLHTPDRQLAIEEAQRRIHAEQTAAAERAAREAAEAELARLRAELAALRSSPAPDA